VPGAEMGVRHPRRSLLGTLVRYEALQIDDPDGNEVGDRAVLAAARSVRPQHAAVGGCAQRAAPVPIPESPVPLMQQRI